MVVESLGTWLELQDPLVGMHLEYSATIFAGVCHSVTFLCSVEREHIGNSVGTMLHRKAPKFPSSTLQVDPVLQCIFDGFFAFLMFVSIA